MITNSTIPHPTNTHLITTQPKLNRNREQLDTFPPNDSNPPSRSGQLNRPTTLVTSQPAQSSGQSTVREGSVNQNFQLGQLIKDKGKDFRYKIILKKFKDGFKVILFYFVFINMQSDFQILLPF